MVKKCIVEYDKQGNPIGIFDLKEFNDVKSFKDFQALCSKNREEFLKRKKAAEEKEAEEKQFLFDEIERLSETLKDAMSGIAYLLGVADLENVNEIFESYVNPNPKGENEDEED